jgi:hypothetical protein
LIADGEAEIGVDLECSIVELKNSDTLWGLLVNASYITVLGEMLCVGIAHDSKRCDLVYKVVAG